MIGPDASVCAIGLDDLHLPTSPFLLYYLLGPLIELSVFRH